MHNVRYYSNERSGGRQGKTRKYGEVLYSVSNIFDPDITE